jgi:hypothetical protein
MPVLLEKQHFSRQLTRQVAAPSALRGPLPEPVNRQTEELPVRWEQLTVARKRVSVVAITVNAVGHRLVTVTEMVVLE